MHDALETAVYFLRIVWDSCKLVLGLAIVAAFLVVPFWTQTIDRWMYFHPRLSSKAKALTLIAVVLAGAAMLIHSVRWPNAYLPDVGCALSMFLYARWLRNSFEQGRQWNDERFREGTLKPFKSKAN